MRSVLDSGLRLVVQEHRTGDIVALQLWIGVGARDESPGEHGFSHLAEHMLFKGTETLGPGFVDREVESVGGRTNAGTSYDYTYYYLLLPASRAARGIEVLADMATSSRFDAEELEREREVVFEEMRRGEDSPRSALYRRLYDLVFLGHAYGHPVLGDPTALRGATSATMRRFYKQHYAPENMVLVVAGPVDPDTVRAVAARAFAPLGRAGHVRAELALPPPISGDRHQTIPRPERQAALGLGWMAPPLGHPDMAAVELLAHILGGSRGSRLRQALRERLRLVSSIDARYVTLERGGVLSITAELEPADEAQVEAAILGEVRRIEDAGVTTAEVERAITATDSERLFAQETVEGLALAYGRAELLWTLEDERRSPERLRAVTAEEVQAAARRYLSAGYARLALLPRRPSP
jgi:zinc protease